MLGFMNKMADEAAVVLRKHFRSLSGDDVDWKNRMDPVTVADREIQDLLLTMIDDSFPQHRVMAEEEENGGPGRIVSLPCEGNGDAGPLWIIDPLDGTNNFVHGLANVAVSIAFVEDGRVSHALVDAPLMGERFTARLQGGAFLNGVPIHVSPHNSLEGAMLCTGFGDLRKHADTRNLRAWTVLAPKVSGIRRFGAAAIDLCWVACGRYDAFWERGLCPWDTAAGSLMVTEAGGTVFNIGRPDAFELVNGDIVAGNRVMADLVHREVLAALDPGQGSDLVTTVKELRDDMAGFVHERGWEKFHNPKNVAVSIAIEAAELMEIFQWLGDDEARALKNRPKEYLHIQEELADTLAYLLSLANFLDIDITGAFRSKMEKNRLRYPPDKVYGKWEN